MQNHDRSREESQLTNLENPGKLAKKWHLPAERLQHKGADYQSLEAAIEPLKVEMNLLAADGFR